MRAIFSYLDVAVANISLGIAVLQFDFESHFSLRFISFLSRAFPSSCYKEASFRMCRYMPKNGDTVPP